MTVLLSDAERQRDVFPLAPPFEVPCDFVTSGLSRACKQRVQRRSGWQCWANDGVDTLNQLYGRSYESGSSDRPVGSTAAALRHVTDAYRCLGQPPETQPEEALQALLGSAAPYYVDAADPSSRAPFVENLISWPEEGTVPVDVAGYLFPEDREFLSGDCSSLLESMPVVSDEPIKPYVDPILKFSPRKLGRFYSRIFKSGMLQFKPGKNEHTVDLFFVKKKNGMLRIICDTRLANTYFKTPKHSNLPTLNAFSNIETDSTHTLFTGAGDIADAFHHMLLPPALRKYFRLPSIQCKFLDRECWPAGCGREDWVTPEYCTLPMGWCWSLYFCQRFLESCATEAGLDPADRIEDKTVLGRVTEGRIVHAEYVDNFLIMCYDRSLAIEYLDRVIDVLRDRGFSVHEIESPSPVVEKLGLIIDGNRHRIQ